ncbi:unnamed protein product [Effrenium voratum]|uniref:PIPK domain-containing protein n=1 Tax=Effrenium voratum TaxID=2562239 RepID=A0AA36JMA3_9DINO|nr:unnamed protein product [Effrenium voratum]CAJ1426823.1 unnamed protein product [Effrenium voratum]
MALDMLFDRAFAARRYPPGTSCTGKHLNATSFCIDICLSKEVDDVTLERCGELCDCVSWHRGSVDLVIGILGCASFCACLLVLVMDLCKARSTRSPAQCACLRWSNFCNLLYSVYFIGYAVSDAWTPMWDGPCSMQDPRGVSKDLLGGVLCRHASPLCFLNCCIVAVPWLEFWGYASYIWNVMWILDLARFTQQPLAPEKVLGIPLMVYYHLFTWPCAAMIALDPDGSRLITSTCREAKIVMMPCVLRRQTMGGDLPWFQVAGSVVIAMAVAVMAMRYMDVGQLLSNGARSQRRERLLLAVRAYLRKQGLHFFCLSLCSVLIFIDTCRACEDDAGNYITAVAFAGFGLLLSLDRLLTIYKKGRTHQESLLEASPLRRNSESLELGSSGNIPSIPLAPPVPDDGPVSTDFAEYRLLDFSALQEQLIQFLRDEELQLAQQRNLSGGSPEQAEKAQMAVLRASARLDDNPDAQWDWIISSANSETALTVMAPRSFTYLRRLAGLDSQVLLSELLHTNVSDLRVAAKSGSSLLCSQDNRTFVLKTVSRSEVRQVRQMLPEWRKHLEENPKSLLCRIYGCFSFRNSLGYYLYAVLMDCLTGLPDCVTEDLGPARVFDIKSEFQDGGFRRCFPRGLRLEPPVATDLEFLSSLGVIDYSLLLSVWEISSDCPELAQGGLSSGRIIQGEDRKYLVRLGIIDFLVHWDVRKRTESALKRTCLHPRHSERVTITDPVGYAKRQLQFLESVFGRG